MKTFAPLILVTLLFTACSPKPPSQVAGSDWLDPEKGGSAYDVLAYPLTEDELAYFELALPVLEATSIKQPQLWSDISSAEDPSFAAEESAFWEEAGLLGQDVIAVSMKLLFLREFASAEEGMEADLQSSLAWLEKRIATDPSKIELLETADSIRANLLVIEAHRKAGAFTFYTQNKDRLDAALDRFTSIGEE